MTSAGDLGKRPQRRKTSFCEWHNSGKWYLSCCLVPGGTFSNNSGLARAPHPGIRVSLNLNCHDNACMDASKSTYELVLLT